MAGTYWITWRIARTGNPDERKQELLAAVREDRGDMWWTESENFLLFNSDDPIDTIAHSVFGALDPEHDLALLASADSQEARGIGAIEDAQLYELMPYAQRYPS